MVRDIGTLLFIGIKGTVIALDRRDGAEVWRAKLKNSGFTSVLWDGEALFAASSGEVFRLDPESGSVRWHNALVGLGLGVVSLAAPRALAQSAPDATLAEQQWAESTAGAAASAT